MKMFKIVVPLTIIISCMPLTIKLHAMEEENAPEINFHTVFAHRDQKKIEELIESLLQSKADINLKDSSEFTPLLKATSRNLTKTAVLLIKNNANVDEVTRKGYSALYLAAYNNNSSIVQLLLQEKANTELADTDGLTPLHIAATNKTTGKKTVAVQEIVESLLAAKANSDHRDIHCKTALEKATPFAKNIIMAKQADLLNAQSLDDIKGPAQQEMIDSISPFRLGPPALTVQIPKSLTISFARQSPKESPDSKELSLLPVELLDTPSSGNNVPEDKRKVFTPKKVPTSTKSLWPPTFFDEYDSKLKKSSEAVEEKEDDWEKIENTDLD